MTDVDIDVYSDLAWRGLIYQSTDEQLLREWLTTGSRTVYIGFDPTADSLHVGSLLQLMLLRRFQRAGHTPIALVGGATGMIGDPSGKSKERNLLSVDALRENVAGLQKQMRGFLNFDESKANAAILVNNFDWMQKFSYVEFLRDVGKHFPVNVMVKKDSVQTRLNSDAGISYTEFSYMLLQAYDFAYLNEHHGCELQIGGSDQWGNITAGIDLARRMRGVTLNGITSPLLTKADGSKMGKTEEGTVWLSAERTSPYQFYQYWIRTDDADVGKCLRFLTELPRERIEELDRLRQSQPEKRDSQKALAESLTDLVHGREGLEVATKASQQLHSGDLQSLTAPQLLEMFADVPSTVLAKSRLDGEGLNILEAFVESGLAQSKGAARRLCQQGGAYVNDERTNDFNCMLSPEHLVAETVIVLRSGKKKYALLRFSD